MLSFTNAAKQVFGHFKPRIEVRKKCKKKNQSKFMMLSNELMICARLHLRYQSSFISFFYLVSSISLLNHTRG